MYEQLQTNTLLLDRYRIRQIVSTSPTSSVYLAIDTRFPDVTRRVAVKEFFNTGTDEAVKRRRMQNFQREGYVLASMAHPGIPRLHEFSVVKNHAYLVMEFVDGKTLEALAAQKPPPEYERIIGWACQICDVLDYMANLAVPLVHRSIQPGHIVIDPTSRVRLIGFGISKIFQNETRSVTIGTEGYTAPEQFDGNPGPQSDIYSLGASLHHILTGADPRQRRPFSFQAFPVRELNPAVPPGLASIVETAVAFNPEDRFSSAAEMKAALETLQSDPTADLQFSRRHIFLSYSRKDTDMMQKLGSDLRKSGFKIWTDEKLTPGTPEWQKAIQDAIEESVGLVVLLSPDSKQSKWVERELSYAEGHGVRIFPVLVRGDQRTAVPLQVMDLQRVDLLDTYNNGLEKLVSALRAHLSPKIG